MNDIAMLECVKFILTIIVSFLYGDIESMAELKTKCAYNLIMYIVTFR